MPEIQALENRLKDYCSLRNFKSKASVSTSHIEVKKSHFKKGFQALRNLYGNKIYMEIAVPVRDVSNDFNLSLSTKLTKEIAFNKTKEDNLQFSS